MAELFGFKWGAQSKPVDAAAAVAVIDKPVPFTEEAVKLSDTLREQTPDPEQYRYLPTVATIAEYYRTWFDAKKNITSVLPARRLLEDIQMLTTAHEFVPDPNAPPPDPDEPPKLTGYQLAFTKLAPELAATFKEITDSVDTVVRQVGTEKLQRADVRLQPAQLKKMYDAAYEASVEAAKAAAAEPSQIVFPTRSDVEHAVDNYIAKWRGQEQAAAAVQVPPETMRYIRERAVSGMQQYLISKGRFDEISGPGSNEKINALEQLVQEYFVSHDSHLPDAEAWVTLAEQASRPQEKTEAVEEESPPIPPEIEKKIDSEARTVLQTKYVEVGRVQEMFTEEFTKRLERLKERCRVVYSTGAEKQVPPRELIREFADIVMSEEEKAAVLEEAPKDAIEAAVHPIITDIHRSQEVLTRYFTDNLSHELRTALTAANTGLQMLVDRLSSGASALSLLPLIDGIMSGCVRDGALIHNFGVLSEAGVFDRHKNIKISEYQPEKIFDLKQEDIDHVLGMIVNLSKNTLLKKIDDKTGAYTSYKEKHGRDPVMSRPPLPDEQRALHHLLVNLFLNADMHGGRDISVFWEKKGEVLVIENDFSGRMSKSAEAKEIVDSVSYPDDAFNGRNIAKPPQRMGATGRLARQGMGMGLTAVRILAKQLNMEVSHSIVQYGDQEHLAHDKKKVDKVRTKIYFKKLSG